MKLGPKYKIARRLGAPIFEKTQTQKFKMRAGAEGAGAKGKRPKPKSEFATQMLEKQKARYTYGVLERQFRKYVKGALAQKTMKAEDKLFASLETRLDNVVYRMGLANSRKLARQIVSHGHMTVNGTRVTIPSYTVYEKDVIAIRPLSQSRTLFEKASEKMKEASVPQWIKVDPEKKEGTIVGVPKTAPGETIFEIASILEFYQR